MDAKEVLAQLKKHHFWVISGIVLVVSLVCWYMAESSLHAAYTSQKAAVEGKFALPAAIRGKPNHPNKSFEEAVNVEHNKLKGLTLTAWERLYNQQRLALQWPRSLGPDYGPRVERIGRKGVMADQDLDLYRNFIKFDFPRLFDIIKVRREVAVKRGDQGNAAANAGSPAGRSGNQEMKEWQGLVAWEEKHRKALESQYVWGRRPTTLQVWYAQEDLWVYENLLNVIKNTNGQATEHLFTPIKKIDALEVGQAASAALGGVGGGGALGGMAGGAAPGGAGGATPGSAGGGGEGKDPKVLDIDGQLTNNRYVNEKGKPLAAGAPTPFAEFNMIPIRMVLWMDQMKVPDLLVECANSPLSIEVRQVRINPGSGITLTGGGAVGGSGGAGGMTAGAMPGGGAGFGGNMGAGAAVGGAGTGSRGMGGGGRNNAALTGQEAELSANDVKVEIIGCVYIFNTPDKEKLGTGAGAEETPVAPVVGPVAGAADAAPPASVDAVPAEGPAPVDGAAQPPANDAAPAADGAAPPADGAPPVNGAAP